MTALPPRDAYRLWAPTYSNENAVTSIEQALVAAMTPRLAGRRLLDAGCGTGRRLRRTGAAQAIGVDLSPEMLAVNDAGDDATLIEGDLRALPLADAMFDVTWCRLAIGHVVEIDQVYAELARVTAPGGTVIVSDFHPVAHAVGHRRTFRLGEARHEVEHHVHTLVAHRDAAGRVGLVLTDMREGAIGPEVADFYAAARRQDLFAEQRGLPVVIALGFVRGPQCDC